MTAPPELVELARELRSLEPGDEFEISGRRLLTLETGYEDGATIIEARKFIDDVELTLRVDDASDVIVVDTGDTTEIIG